MYHVKGSSMKNFKRIAALAGVVILLLIFCLPMAFAWGSSENAQALFRGAFAAAVLVPIVAYVFWMAYRIWGNKKPREDENRMIENIIFDVGNVLMGRCSRHLQEKSIPTIRVRAEAVRNIRSAAEEDNSAENLP